MKLLSKLFLRGLATLLPIVLTCYLIWWFVAGVETALGSVFRWLFPNIAYRVGMGFTLSIVFTLVVGVLMYSFVARAVYRRVTGILQRIPVVKVVYGMVADVLRLFGSGQQQAFRQVVLVRLAEEGAEMLGFVTRDDFNDLPVEFADETVAVYIPMSYQLGGFTVLVPRARVRPVAIGAEQALRFCVTAGVSRGKEAG